MAVKKRVSKAGKVSWLCQVFLGYDQNGKRKEVTKTFATRKEATIFEADTKSQISRGTFQEPNRQTLDAYLDDWIEKSARVRLKTQTVQLYRDLIRIYIKPGLGHIQLTKLNPMTVQAFFNELADEGSLAPATIRNILTTLRSALTQAVKWQILHHSPAAHIDIPRTDEQKKIRSFSPQEVGRLLDACKTERNGIIFAFGLMTGARPGEYLALQWSDLDLSSRTVRIDKTLVRPTGGGWKFEPPKTKRSIRTIPLPPELMELLRVHRTKHLERKLFLGPDWKGEGDFIFTNELGGPHDEKKLNRRYFKGIIDKARIDGPFRLYDLRHTCATMLLLGGEQALVVADRLGHSSVTTTLDRYSHVLPSMQQGATDKLRAMFFA